MLDTLEFGAGKETNNMVGRIIGLIACLLCAVPFLIISVYDKGSSTPISFWSGDKSLMEKVHDIAGYNKEMADLYKKCAIAFGIAGVGCLIHLVIGITIILLECTVGIYLVYKKYKIILKKYS